MTDIFRPRFTPPQPQPRPLRWLRLMRHPSNVMRWAQGRAVRAAYASLLPRIARRPVAVAPAIPLSVCSFSSSRDLPEQVASLRSFLRTAGRPDRWTVISDGSHSSGERALLEGIDACVSVIDWDAFARQDLPAAVNEFAGLHPLGRKLSAMMSLPDRSPSLMVDSDVLFLPGAGTLRRELQELRTTGPRYQLDCYDVLSGRLVPDEMRGSPTNTGIVLMAGRPHWDAGTDRLRDAEIGRDDSVDGAWIEQGVVHLAMRASGARPLDPDRFVITDEDVFRLAPLHVGADAVARHYAGPTRHLMWCAIASRAGR